MRISDWSSDVCSSDLGADRLRRRFAGVLQAHAGRPRAPVPQHRRRPPGLHRRGDAEDRQHQAAPARVLRPAAQGGPGGQARGSVPRAGRRRAALLPGHARWLATGHLLRRSEEHTSELQSLMRISYAVFCLKKKITTKKIEIKSFTYYTLYIETYPL